MLNIRYLTSYFHSGAIRSNKEMLLQLLAPKDSDNFLEIGPGNGQVLELAVNMRLKSVTALEYPGTGNHLASIGCKVIECNIGNDRWPFEDGQFQSVIANQVFEHIPKTDWVFSEASRILDKGGRVLISVPNLASWSNIIILMFGFQPPLCNVSDNYRGVGFPMSSHRLEFRDLAYHSHLRLFTLPAIREMCALYGLRVVKAHGGSYGVPLIGQKLAKWMPRWGLFTTVVAEKVE